jgi:hypothetical protein
MYSHGSEKILEALTELKNAEIMDDGGPDIKFICEQSVTASLPEHTQVFQKHHDLSQPEFLKATNTHLCTLITNPTQDSHNLNTTDNYELKNFYAQQ